MNVTALVLALVMVVVGPATGRGYDGVQQVAPAADAPSAVADAPAAATPPAEAPASSPASRPPAPRPVETPLSSTGLPPRRTAIQRAGVAMIVAGAAGYVVMVAGLGLGAAARSDLAPLRSRDEIERRRAVLDRGVLANRLALGAGIAAGVVLAVGITLVAIARRRTAGTHQVALVRQR